MGKIAGMSKKGIFFTLISVTLMAIFILIYTPQADITLQKDTQSTKSRIDSLNNYVNDLEKTYFETVVSAAAYKTILSLIFYENSTNSYLKNFDAAFYEVMINGTINGVPIDSITGKKIMENNTLMNWSKKIAAAAKDTYNANTTILLKNVTAAQAKPFSIYATLIMDLDVQSNAAEWKIENLTISSSISIEGLDDVLYLVNTNGKATNKIKMSSVQFNQWNITKVREALKNGTYVHWEQSDAPSFLMRFTNTTTDSNCCGIESFVNPNNLDAPDQIGSYADYQFWNQTFITQCSLLYNITNPATGGGLWDEFRYFKLDIGHIAKYNITDNDAVRAC